jgi:hypothetical protein
MASVESIASQTLPSEIETLDVLLLKCQEWSAGNPTAVTVRLLTDFLSGHHVTVREDERCNFDDGNLALHGCGMPDLNGPLTSDAVINKNGTKVVLKGVLPAARSEQVSLQFSKTDELERAAEEKTKKEAANRKTAAEAVAAQKPSDRIGGRVILYRSDPMSGDVTPLALECNGVVISTKTWKLLTRPPQAFNMVPDYATVDKILAANEYEAVQMHDGTVVNLYPWACSEDPKKKYFAVGTARSHEIDTYNWAADKCFAEVVHDVLRQYVDVELVTDHRGGKHINLPGVSRNRTYTLGIRSKDHHPYLPDPPCAWNIQRTELSTGKVTVSEGIEGVPNQKSVELPEGATCVKLREMYEGCLASAIEHARDQSYTPPNGYGVILRARPGTAAAGGGHASVAISSDLHEALRNLVYRGPARDIRGHIYGRGIFPYNVIRSVLIRDETLPSLLVQYADQHSKIKEWLDSLKRESLAVVRATAMDNGGFNASDSGATMASAGHIARRIIDAGINPFTNNSDQAVLDTIYRPNLAFLYGCDMGYFHA